MNAVSKIIPESPSSQENSSSAPATLDAELSAARTDTVAVSEADYAESLRMAEEIGKVKMAQAISSGLSLSVIRWFSSMRESGAYKGKLLIGPDGNTFRPDTFEKFCEGMGFSKSYVCENLQNFGTLGERYLSEAQELGLKVRDMRKVRKALKDAPEETKQEVFAAPEKTARKKCGRLLTWCAPGSRKPEPKTRNSRNRPKS